MQNEILMDDSPKNKDEKNYNSWELSGNDDSVEITKTAQQKDSKIKSSPPQQQKQNKNSAAKAVSHARSAVGNTNPNIRTGLSDNLNNTGTNVAYTEKED